MMADKEQLAIIRRGTQVWNQWRIEHPSTIIDFSDANLNGADLSDADLSDAILNGANLSDAILNGANLSDANLNGADLYRADLIGADLSGAFILLANLNWANLSRASLREAHLCDALLFSADLSEADLSKADLSRAYLSYANFSDADLSDADLSETNLNGANLNGANLNGANLSSCQLVQTQLQRATLTQTKIYGISVWDVTLDDAIQQDLVITDDQQPRITVDNLEVAQFVYLLLNHHKLRSVLNAVTERGVLLLGRFGGGGLAVLEAIAETLRASEHNYLPMIFDFARPDQRDYTETIKTLAGLARFVIVDLSGPSVPQELYATVPHLAIPFIPILEADRKPHAMLVDFYKYPWFSSKVVRFANVDELHSLIPTQIIAVAEEMHQERQRKLDELFHQ
jgi:uncharacterized protein YjbI with pentapeptide repeats